MTLIHIVVYPKSLDLGLGLLMAVKCDHTDVMDLEFRCRDQFYSWDRFRVAKKYDLLVYLI